MFWDRFYSECEKKNIKPNKIAKELGFSNAIMTQWKKGSPPNSEKLIQVADYLNVSIDYLLERDLGAIASDQEERILLNDFRSADQLGRDRISYTAETEAKRTKEENMRKSTA